MSIACDLPHAIVFLCKKTRDYCGLSDICSNFATDYKTKRYETIRRLAALRREYREGQGLQGVG